jgi:membrane-bound lytic murein transglycosylase D
MRRAALAVATLLLVCTTFVCAQQDLLERKTYPPERRISDLEREVYDLKRELAGLQMPPVPESLPLCGKPVPLQYDDIRERFEREYYQFLENRGLLIILVKRQAKFQGIISEELQRAGLPQDLMYVALTESYLNPRSVSKANAGGAWQFIKETGKREGLAVTDTVDERFSVKRSTRSALAYLKKLHEEFGDWFLVMAAYNSGENRVREAIAQQNTRDFFDMHLPEETDRYIYRVAALKEILGNPKKYGLVFDRREYYRPFAVTEYVLEFHRDVHTSTLAQAMDLPYKNFRELNLHLRKYTLPKGTYYVYVPVDRRETFNKRIQAVPGVGIQKEDGNKRQ